MDEDPQETAKTGTSRDERLRIVEAVMPGFWAVSGPGTMIGVLLRELDRYVANGPNSPDD